MPVYNAEKNLENSINSILQQTLGFNNIEFIIIDDFSTDNSRKIIEKYAKNYKNIIPKYLDKNTGFPGNVRNIGLNMAHANYVMFLDSDDTYNADAFEILYQTINKNEYINIVDSKHNIMVNNTIKEFKTDKIKSEKNMICVDPLTEPFINNIYVWGKIYRKSFLKKFNIIFPENQLGEDNVFNIKSFLNSGNIIFLNKYYSYNYNIRDEGKDLSLTNSIKKENIINSIKTYFLIVEILKEYNRNDLIPIIFNKRIPDLLSYFVRLKKTDKKMTLIEFYKFYQFVDFKVYSNELWARMIEKPLKKEKFDKAIFISEIIKNLYKLNFLKNIYRKIYLNIK